VDSTDKVVIAVDGTSGSGKSTNSRLVASSLGFNYVDTGAMYRTLAWYCLDRGIDVNDEDAVSSAVRTWGAQLADRDHALRLEVDGYFPEKEIRTAATSAVVSAVASYPAVRQWMKDIQRQCLSFGSMVMEGRDIGSNIFPETPLKFYMDASLDEREQRRAAEGVVEDLAERDRRDSQRKANPLVVSDGAALINTSGLTPDQSSAMMLEYIKKKLSEQSGPDAS
jgi:cytidylate kinase